jgi:hypothetical protein
MKRRWVFGKWLGGRTWMLVGLIRAGTGVAGEELWLPENISPFSGPGIASAEGLTVTLSHVIRGKEGVNIFYWYNGCIQDECREGNR